MMRVRVGKFNGRAEFTLSATAGPYRDQVTRTVMVKPLGFPIEDGAGGLLRPGDTVSHEFAIPEDLVRGSLASRIVVYPTPLASMTEALERLIQEPYGCFEQTSSTTYPLVMAQQYFLSHQGVDPSLVERSGEILAKGYERLLGFECQSGGYEWFGSDPGHDALTAYGLLEFTDMAARPPRRSGDARSARARGCWPSATAKAAMPARRTRCTRGWPNPKWPTPTTPGRCWKPRSKAIWRGKSPGSATPPSGRKTPTSWPWGRTCCCWAATRRAPITCWTSWPASRPTTAR